MKRDQNILPLLLIGTLSLGTPLWAAASADAQKKQEGKEEANQAGEDHKKASTENDEAAKKTSAQSGERTENNQNNLGGDGTKVAKDMEQQAAEATEKANQFKKDLEDAAKKNPEAASALLRDWTWDQAQKAYDFLKTANGKPGGLLGQATEGILNAEGQAIKSTVQAATNPSEFIQQTSDSLKQTSANLRQAVKTNFAASGRQFQNYARVENAVPEASNLRTVDRKDGSAAVYGQAPDGSTRVYAVDARESASASLGDSDMRTFSGYSKDGEGNINAVWAGKTDAMGNQIVDLQNTYTAQVEVAGGKAILGKATELDSLSAQGITLKEGVWDGRSGWQVDAATGKTFAAYGEGKDQFSIQSNGDVYSQGQIVDLSQFSAKDLESGSLPSPDINTKTSAIDPDAYTKMRQTLKEATSVTSRHKNLASAKRVLQRTIGSELTYRETTFNGKPTLAYLARNTGGVDGINPGTLSGFFVNPETGNAQYF